MTSLEIYEGNDKSYSITINDSDSNPIDITGYTILFTVKYKISDSDDEAIISKNITTHSDAVNGQTSIAISREETLNIKNAYYPYDIQMEDDSGSRTTLLKGLFQIKQSVTDRDI